ncbi:MAG: hypothetical protein K9J74_09635 [Sulfuritalea sp.]|nr:hypothetical protein [Sulfuritalea sp.]
MIQAIGASVAYLTASTGTGTAPVSSDAQFLRLQKELSDCVNCATAKTALGKAKILAIEARINALKARLDAAAARPQRDDGALQALQLNHAQANPDQALTNGTVGNIINTSA